MAAKRHSVLLWTGYVLTALAVAGVVVNVFYRVFHAGFLDRYRTAYGLEWYYGAAFPTILALTFVGPVVLGMRAIKRWRER